jgi:hypothetical protein
MASGQPWTKNFTTSAVRPISLPCPADVTLPDRHFSVDVALPGRPCLTTFVWPTLPDRRRVPGAAVYHSRSTLRGTCEVPSYVGAPSLRLFHPVHVHSPLLNSVVMHMLATSRARHPPSSCPSVRCVTCAAGASHSSGIKDPRRSQSVCGLRIVPWWLPPRPGCGPSRSYIFHSQAQPLACCAVGPRWCACSWTTTLTPIGVMEANGRRYTGSYAIRDDDVAAMREILRRGAKVNTSVLALERPLHEAAKRSLDTVELFVEYGANVKVKDV